MIRDFRESINQSNHDAQSMSEEEFRQLVDYIRRRASIDSDPTGPHQEQNTSQEILEEVLRQIIELLSSVTETRTTIKFSLALHFSGHSLSFSIVNDHFSFEEL